MEYNVIHVRGKGNLNPSLTQQGYKQFEYVDAELADYFALCDLMIGRAGANTIFELLCLMKPSVLIPLPKEVSRGDQILNARYFPVSYTHLDVYKRQDNRWRGLESTDHYGTALHGRRSRNR